MNSQISENHPSYQNHRRQFWAQIFLPILLAVLLIIAFAVLTGIAAFGNNGDAPRWAAISTIWLVIPVMIFGLIILIILAGLIYLLAQALKVTPPYSYKAQYYVNRGASEVKRFSDMSTTPVLFIEEIKASIKAILDGIRKEIL
jgi:FtsH-binding integral membrane protein